MRIYGVWCMLTLTCSALAAGADDGMVGLVETDDALCLAHGGQMVSLQLAAAAITAQAEAWEVWVDRWFMQVQTADHTRHLLRAEAPEQTLGCSHSIAGPQHWTIHSIRRLPVAGKPDQKE